MSVLSDTDIARELGYGELDVYPIDLDGQLQPASLDVRLGNEVKVFSIEKENQIIDVNDFDDEEYLREVEKEDGGFLIKPGKSYLANTVENFEIPDYLLGRLTGRSSVGRLHVEVHKTAGLFDPGFSGEGVFEIENTNEYPVKLYPDMRIAQMVFEELKSTCNKPYNSSENKYQEQTGAVGSKIGQDFNET